MATKKSVIKVTYTSAIVLDDNFDIAEAISSIKENVEKVQETGSCEALVEFTDTKLTIR